MSRARSTTEVAWPFLLLGALLLACPTAPSAQASPHASQDILAALCASGHFPSPQDLETPASTQPVLEAVRLLLAQQAQPSLETTCGDRNHRILRLLEAFIEHLRLRNEVLQTAGSRGFHSLGSLLASTEGWIPLEQALPALLGPAVASLPPEMLQQFLDQPETPLQRRLRAASVLSLLAASLLDPATDPTRVLGFARQLVRLQVQATPPESMTTQAADWANRLLLDPPLLLERPALVPLVLENLGRFAQDLPEAQRDPLLLAFNQGPLGADFRWSEIAEAAAGVLVRPSLDLPAPKEPAIPESSAFGPIQASVYSLPSHFFQPDEAKVFLTTLLQRLPSSRKLLVLTDFRMRQAIGLQHPRLIFLETYGRYYSAWPRDPFLFAALGDQTGLVFRPPLESKRQEDSFLAHELFRKLPEPLRADLRLIGPIPSPFRFHVGNLLFGKRRLYLSVHSLEEETLARQQQGQLPPADRATPQGLETFLRNTRVLASELGQAWGREPFFVHPFPPEIPPEILRAGGGRDLDSVLTVLEDPDGVEVPIVGSLTLGLERIEALQPEDLEALHRGLGLRPIEMEPLRHALRAHQQTPSSLAFQAYLDRMSDHLRQQTGRSERLPLLLFPTRLLLDAQNLKHPDFLLGWTNLVAEHRPDTTGIHRSVELFSPYLPSGDRLACGLYERLGYSCILLPALRNSVVFGGGYRCASNHLRARVPGGIRPNPGGI